MTLNILTFDLEEWFHLFIPQTPPYEKWDSCEKRFALSVEPLLELLDEKKIKATFFSLGWIAQHYPHLLRRISEFGHDVGTHSHMHTLVHEMTPEAFRKDLRTSIDAIERATGKKVTMYRAPGFSLFMEQLWIYQILLEEGITLSSSLINGRGPFGGISDQKFSQPFIFNLNEKKILEFPLCPMRFLGKKVIHSGGGFFRFMPYPIIKKMTQKSTYTMCYFHPRDFDTEQPHFDVHPIAKFIIYYGINGAMAKLKRFIDDFEFVSITQAVEVLEFEEVNLAPLL